MFREMERGNSGDGVENFGSPNPQKVRFVKHKSSQEIFKRINERIGPRTKGKEHLWFQAVNTQS